MFLILAQVNKYSNTTQLFQIKNPAICQGGEQKMNDQSKDM